jgi:seryl-tRNA synthetase
MDESMKKIVQTYSCRITDDVRSQLTELMDTGKFATQNQMIETLVEAYLNPKKEKSRAKELESEIEKLKKDNEGFNLVNETLRKANQDLSKQNDALAEELKNVRSELNDVKSKLPSDNQMVIPVTEFERKVLESLCKRENQKRKRTDLNPEIFVMFVIEEMLVNANVFTIDVLSNSELNRIRRELQNDVNND